MSDPFLDTNILIDWLLQKPPAFEELMRYDAPRISRVAWAEVLAGEPPETRDRVVYLMRRFDIAEVTADIATAAADIRHRTRMKLLDALIYATAQVHGVMLVTRNTKDFPPNMPGIRVPYTL